MSSPEVRPHRMVRANRGLHFADVKNRFASGVAFVRGVRDAVRQPPLTGASRPGFAACESVK